MTATDDERWNSLFSTLNGLPSSQAELKSQMQILSSNVEAYNKRMETQESKMTSLESRMDSFFNFQRAKNLVLFKLEDSPSINDNLIPVIQKLFCEIGLDIQKSVIDDAFRMGKTMGNRHVLVKFVAARWVKKIFSKVGELKKRNLFISNDRSKAEREQRRLLLLRVRELRASWVTARIVGNKIVTDNSKSAVNPAPDPGSSQETLNSSSPILGPIDWPYYY